MTKLDRIAPKFVEYIPEQLQAGVLYISRRYSTASHLCCCGCGQLVVTPFNPSKWRLQEVDGSVSLSPSIGNWSFPCRSHYWIERNRVRWAGTMTKRQIAMVQQRDLRDVIAAPPHLPTVRPSMAARATEIWRAFVKWLLGQ